MPSESILNQRIIFSAYKGALLGRVTMTMKNVRSQYWIPTLRNHVNFITRNCCASKKYQARSYPDPKPGPLTKDRTEQCFQSQVIDVDYLCPIFFQRPRKV